MRKFKKLSIFLIFVCALFSGFLGFNTLIPVYADNNVELVVEKVTYKNNLLEKKLGEYPTTNQTELAALKNAIDEVEANATSTTIINNEDIVSISNSGDTYEAIIVKLQPTDNNIIQILNPNLTINGVMVQLLPYKLGNTESYMFIGAYDFSSVNTIIDNFDYSNGGHFEFEFTYNDQGSTTQTFSFYMIDETKFNGENFPKINSAEQIDSNYYFYNQNKNNPSLTFNPYKFAPTIKYLYNETVETITTELDTAKKQITFTSTNQYVFKDQTVNIKNAETPESASTEISFDTIGKYEITYDIVFFNNVTNSYTTLSNENSGNLNWLIQQNLNIIGYSAYYKNYNNSGLYEKLYNEKYLSNFTYNFVENSTFNASIDKLILDLNNKDIKISDIASTNQAPVKIISNVSESLDGATYYKITTNDEGKYVNGTALSYNSSIRFEEDGLYAVIIPYKFSNFSDATLYSVILFKIENEKPTLNFYNLTDNTELNFDNLTLISKNNFTNKDVYIIWDSESVSPFSVKTSVKITKNGEVLTNFEKQLLGSDKNYVKMSDNGVYLVQISYGIYNTTIEKTFTIDKSNIEYEIKEVENNSLTDNITLSEDYALTNKNFSIFVKNKEVSNNKVTVTYNYIPLNKNEDDVTFINNDSKIYITNNYELKTIYSNLTYTNSTINNLNEFSEETLENNSNAIISNNALYIFTISDNAGNSITFTILLDNTSPIVLQTFDNANYSVFNNQAGVENLISEDYSLVFGNYKAIKVQDAVKDYVKNYITLEENNYIISKISDVTVNVIDVVTNTDITVNLQNEYTLNLENNILNVFAPIEEIEHNYKISFKENDNNYECNFTLNTDKNKITIKDSETGTTRIQQNHASNAEKVYISFINSSDPDYALKSLKLNYYSFNSIENSKFVYSENAIEFDLLALSQSDNNGGFITSLINPTYLNGQYVTKEGKYEIVKEYVNAEAPEAQTFYINRTSPLNFYTTNTTLFKFGDIFNGKTLNIEQINYFINNNQTLQTNITSFYSLLDSLQLQYSNNLNYKLNYTILNSNNEVVSLVNNKFITSGIYTIVVYDNSFTNSKSDKNYTNANSVSFRVNLINDAPAGKFITDNNIEITEYSSSTKSNSLKFVFEDNYSNYMYDIDIYNIVLSLNGNIILKTQKKTSSNYFALDNQTSVYYFVSDAYKGLFNLSREELSTSKLNGEKRYRYTLTILDTNQINSVLYENGISKEGVFNLQLNFTNTDLILNDKTFGTSNYNIVIDHTAPKSNISKLIEQDGFLSETEKELMLDSILNKDKTSNINFENYAFVITEPLNYLIVNNEIDYTDTNLVYIRKYNKYLDNSIINLQSLVIGDSDYSDTSITRYRFDVNALLDGTNLYTATSYDQELENFFQKGFGYYEIIEIDKAENYTIYSILYLNNYNYSINYSFENNGSQNETNKTGNITVNGTNLEIKAINDSFNYLNNSEEISAYNSLDITLTIQQSNSVNTTEHLRYSPILIEDENIKYFNNKTSLINYINNKITNVTNHIGTNIKFSNQNKVVLEIQNNIPTNEINYENYIRSYDDRIVVTIPREINNTSVKAFNVYPVIDGQKSENVLHYDSLGKIINTNADSTFTFMQNIYGSTDSTSIYYLQFIDNFGRIYNTVKTVGATDTKSLNFPSDATIVTLNNETYVNSQNVTLEYSPDLYSLKVYYMLLPNTFRAELTITDENSSINLLNLLTTINPNYSNQQIKFIIELTSLTNLLNEEESVYTLSYIYYPLMPSIEFTDSASNSLNILPESENNTSIINTSKNVSLSYSNNTLFNISINAIRTYENSLGEEVIEEINNIGNFYTFNEIGNYKIIVTNDLGNTKTYKFNITPATNKTFRVLTDESNMINFEILPSKISTVIDNINFDVYYSIYNTTIETNSDFNLIATNYTPSDSSFKEEFSNLWIISKGDSPYKYIAVKKIAYNSNFLNVGGEDTFLKIEETSGGADMQTNLAEENLKGYSITSTNDVSVIIPLYNETGTHLGNVINIKVYYNNKLINLNNNIYSTYENDGKVYQKLNLSSAPAGVYSIYFEDLAGNTQTFAGNSFLNLILLNEVAITLNNNSPVDYQYFNSTVNLRILEQRQYNTNSITISVNKNGEEYTKYTRDNSGNYVFTDYGFYTVTISAIVPSGAERSKTAEISKTIHFTILNANIAYKEFSFISLNGQNISKILKNGIDVTNEIKKFLAVGNDESVTIESFENAYLYNLELASKMVFKYYQMNNDGEYLLDENGNRKESYEYYNGNGVYEIFVDTQNNILDTITYSFRVWIRDENTKISLNSSVNSGDSTSNAITFTYNPYLIYSQIGECSIYINDELIIDINVESENNIKTFTIPRDRKGTFIVQVKSDNNTELSYVVNKTEPLSTVSIIVIVLSSLLVVGFIFMFIKLRRRIKIK